MTWTTDLIRMGIGFGVGGKGKNKRAVSHRCHMLIQTNRICNTKSSELNFTSKARFLAASRLLVMTEKVKRYFCLAFSLSIHNITTNRNHYHAKSIKNYTNMKVQFY